MRTNTKINLAIIAIVITLFTACEGSDDNDDNAAELTNVDRPMPCGEGEVYVWDDYPNTADCVSNDDHEAHTDQAPPDLPRRPTTDTTLPDPVAALYACRDKVLAQGGGTALVEGYGVRCTVDENGNVMVVPAP